MHVRAAALHACARSSVACTHARISAASVFAEKRCMYVRRSALRMFAHQDSMHVCAAALHACQRAEQRCTHASTQSHAACMQERAEQRYVHASATCTQALRAALLACKRTEQCCMHTSARRSAACIQGRGAAPHACKRGLVWMQRCSARLYTGSAAPCAWIHAALLRAGG